MRLIQPILSPVIYIEPYFHAVVDRFLLTDIAQKLVDKFPGPDDAAWVQYNNVLEKKRVQPNLSQLDPVFEDVFNELNGQSIIKWVEELTGLSNLVPDPSLNGGGLHLHVSEQHLDLHLDYTHHLNTGLKRVCNLILYLNDVPWEKEYGGELEIWSSECDKENVVSPNALIRKISPIHNRAVIFLTPDAIHGVNGVQDTNDALGRPLARKSIALYYYQNDGTAGKERKGTRFLPRPGEKVSSETMELRRIRQNGNLNSSPLSESEAELRKRRQTGKL